jgi:hypothetical protein
LNANKKPVEWNNKAKGEDRKDKPKKALVCFFDLKVGHSWHECHNKPDGWQPSEEDVQKAMEKKRELDKQADKKGAAPKKGHANVARVSHGEPSQPAQSSRSGGGPSTQPSGGRVTLHDI